MNIQWDFSIREKEQKCWYMLWIMVHRNEIRTWLVKLSKGNGSQYWAKKLQPVHLHQNLLFGVHFKCWCQLEWKSSMPKNITLWIRPVWYWIFFLCMIFYQNMAYCCRECLKKRPLKKQKSKCFHHFRFKECRRGCNNISCAIGTVCQQLRLWEVVWMLNIWLIL